MDKFQQLSSSTEEMTQELADEMDSRYALLDAKCSNDFRKRIMDAYKKVAEGKKLTDKELRDRILAPYIKERLKLLEELKKS